MLDVGWICELGPWLFLQTPDLSNLHNSYEQDQVQTSIVLLLQSVVIDKWVFISI